MSLVGVSFLLLASADDGTFLGSCRGGQNYLWTLK